MDEVLPKDSEAGGSTIYAYANNHYSGFGPATIEEFRKLCREEGVEIPRDIQLPMKLAAGTLSMARIKATIGLITSRER
jgi:hypothetical protein